SVNCAGFRALFFFHSEVSIHPGLIALTRTVGPRLTASAWVRARIPPLEAEEASVWGSYVRARVEAMLMMEARPAVRSRGRPYFAHKKTLRRLTWITRSHSSTESSSSGRKRLIPALLHRLCSLPRSLPI